MKTRIVFNAIIFVIKTPLKGYVPLIPFSYKIYVPQDLFFKFMLNNFLHTQVEQCLTAILTKAPIASSPQGETDHLLLTQLFTKCHIIERVVAAYEDTSEPHE